MPGDIVRVHWSREGAEALTHECPPITTARALWIADSLTRQGDMGVTLQAQHEERTPFNQAGGVFLPDARLLLQRHAAAAGRASGSRLLGTCVRADARKGGGGPPPLDQRECAAAIAARAQRRTTRRAHSLDLLV